jgi:hypothetical protein
MFGFYVSVRGKAANWIVGIVFSIIGGLIAFVLPPLFSQGENGAVAAVLLRVLGGVFLFFGIVNLALMLGYLALKAKSPPLHETWYWWGNFLGGLLAAGLFAVPATLAFPALLLAYLLRPNVFFPANAPEALQNLWVGALFSVVGIGVLLMMYFIGRAYYRGRPNR